MVAEWTLTDDGRLKRVDGRVLRSSRTRDKVVGALLSLLNEGKLRPTAREIAERGHVSLRSVFQHFEDLESLYAALAEMQAAQVDELTGAIPAEGALGNRIQGFVKQRTRILEAITPVRRAAILREPFSAVLARRLRWAHDMAREEVERTFAPELSVASTEERDDLLWALDAASNWAAWDTLRRIDGLSIEDSKRVMLRTMRALLREVSA